MSADALGVPAAPTLAFDWQDLSGPPNTTGCATSGKLLRDSDPEFFQL